MSKIKADSVETLAGVSTTMANVVNGSAKAWVNFNGVGAVSIRAAHNVSSITDNAVGDYTVNFTTPMVDANYAIVVTRGNNPSNGLVGVNDLSSPPTASAFRMATANPGNTAVQDVPYAFAAVYR